MRCGRNGAKRQQFSGYSLYPFVSYNAIMGTILPDIATSIFEKLSGINDRLAKLEERTDWSKALIVVILVAILGGVAWSGFQQFQVGSLTEISRNNASQIEQLQAAIELQTKSIDKLSDSRESRPVYTSSHAQWEQGITRNIIRTGTLAVASKLEGSENTYRIPMLVAISPVYVRQMWIGFEEPPIGISATARLVESGKFCDIEIIADDPVEFAKKIEEGIEVIVTFSVSDPPLFEARPVE